MSTALPSSHHDAPQMSAVERLVFAAGDLFGGGGGSLLSVLYFFFLTDVVGLQPGLAGGVFATAKVVDAVGRPIMGQLTDNTRTRWGRRRPWLAVGSVGILVGYALMWAPVGGLESQLGKAAFALVTLVFFMVVSMAVTVPYSSMSTETTTSLAERNKLNLMRLGFSTFASSLVFIGATALVAAYKAGHLGQWSLYAILVFGFGLAFAVPTLAVALMVRERTPLPATRERFRMSVFTRGFDLPAFRSLLGLYLCAMLMMDGIGAVLIAYTTYVTTVAPALFMAILIVVNLVFVTVSQKLVTTVSKNRLYGALLPLGVVSGAGLALWPSTWPTWPVYLIAFGLAVGSAGAQMMSWVMFPDVVDAGELAFGERTPGAFSGLMSLVRSLCSAGLVAGLGLVLQATGYEGKRDGVTVLTQPDSALIGLRAVLFLVLVGFMATGWFLSRRYPLTRSVCAQQTADLLTARGTTPETDPAISAPLRTGFEDDDLEGLPRKEG